MKDINKILLLISFCLLWNIGCRKDYFLPLPQADLSKPVSFSGDVIPVFTANCAKSGCHVSGGQTPDLEAGTAYDQLLGLGYVDTTNAEGSILYLRLTSATSPMPPDGKLPADKINKVLTWIKQGAQNN